MVLLRGGMGSRSFQYLDRFVVVTAAVEKVAHTEDDSETDKVGNSDGPALSCGYSIVHLQGGHLKILSLGNMPFGRKLLTAALEKGSPRLAVNG